jgi:hypothetical protein
VRVGRGGNKRRERGDQQNIIKRDGVVNDLLGNAGVIHREGLCAGRRCVKEKRSRGDKFTAKAAGKKVHREGREGAKKKDETPQIKSDGDK